MKYKESKSNHKYKGWFYYHATKTFYRWNELIKVIRKHEEK